MAIGRTIGLSAPFCESYCRAVTAHHRLEDRRPSPHLQAVTTPFRMLDRLAQEHEVVAEILTRIDAALVALVAAEPDGMTGFARISSTD